MKFDFGKRGSSLDISEMPRFEEAKLSFSQIMAATFIDFGLLIFYTIAALVGAVVAFLRYEVR